jgi:hypothetical protein
MFDDGGDDAGVVVTWVGISFLLTNDSVVALGVESFFLSLSPVKFEE